MPEHDDSESLAWERMKAAIMRCRAKPTDENRAEVARLGRELTRLMEAGDQHEDAA